MDLAVEVPNDELGAVATSEMWDEIYDRIAEPILRSSAPRSFSSIRAACPSASPTRLADGWATTSSCRITAACRAPCATTPNRGSRTAS